MNTQLRLKRYRKMTSLNTTTTIASTNQETPRPMSSWSASIFLASWRSIESPWKADDSGDQL